MSAKNTGTSCCAVVRPRGAQACRHTLCHGEEHEVGRTRRRHSSCWPPAEPGGHDRPVGSITQMVLPARKRPFVTNFAVRSESLKTLPRKPSAIAALGIAGLPRSPRAMIAATRYDASGARQLCFVLCSPNGQATPTCKDRISIPVHAATTAAGKESCS